MDDQYWEDRERARREVEARERRFEEMDRSTRESQRQMEERSYQPLPRNDEHRSSSYRTPSSSYSSTPSSHSSSASSYSELKGPPPLDNLWDKLTPEQQRLALEAKRVTEKARRRERLLQSTISNLVCLCGSALLLFIFGPDFGTLIILFLLTLAISAEG